MKLAILIGFLLGFLYGCWLCIYNICFYFEMKRGKGCKLPEEQELIDVEILSWKRLLVVFLYAISCDIAGIFLINAEF